MEQEVFPISFSRQNYFAPRYAEIAMQAYFDANICFEKLQAEGFLWPSYLVLEKMENDIIVTVVFSAMCMESFLNNYAATCLGDDEFYNNFDKLSVISKLQLIAKFILKAPIDKSRSYYSRLKALTRQRDAFVHNKSKTTPRLEAPATEIDTEPSCPEDDVEKMSLARVREMKEDLHTALEALKAIRDVALFFDQYDKNAHALSFLINPAQIFWGEPEEKTMKEFILKQLAIRPDVRYKP